MATSTAGSSLTRQSDQGHQIPAMVIPLGRTKETRDRSTLLGPAAVGVPNPSMSLCVLSSTTSAGDATELASRLVPRTDRPAGPP